MLRTLIITALAVAGNSALFFLDKSLAAYSFGATIIIAVLASVAEFVK